MGDTVQVAKKAHLKRTSWLLLSLVLCVVVSRFLAFLYGYLDGSNPIVFWFGPIVYFGFYSGLVIPIICLIVTIVLAIRKRPLFRFLMIWLIFTFVNLVQPYYFEVAGALTAFYLAGPTQVIEESRRLIHLCQQCSDRCADCGYMLNIPPAIERVHPEVVFVWKNSISIGKCGFIHPDGFIIFSEGITPPHQPGLFKLTDDLYWGFEH